MEISNMQEHWNIEQYREYQKKGKSASNLSGKNRQARARYETDRCGIHIR